MWDIILNIKENKTVLEKKKNLKKPLKKTPCIWIQQLYIS